MRKEVVSAILIGVVLGFVIIYGLQLANKSAKEAATTTNPATTVPESPAITNPNPTTTVTNTGLSVTTPLDNFVSSTPSITVSGSSFPNSSVIVTTDEEEIIVEASSTGAFTTSVKLTSGENLLKVASVNPNTNKLETKELVVIYTTAKLD